MTKTVVLSFCKQFSSPQAHDMAGSNKSPFAGQRAANHRCASTSLALLLNSIRGSQFLGFPGIHTHLQDSADIGQAQTPTGNGWLRKRKTPPSVDYDSDGSTVPNTLNKPRGFKRVTTAVPTRPSSFTIPSSTSMASC